MAVFDGNVLVTDIKGLVKIYAWRRKNILFAGLSLLSNIGHHNYRTRKEKEHSHKSVSSSPATSTPTLVEPKDCNLIGQVRGGGVLEETPAGKKKLRSFKVLLHLTMHKQPK